jgi:DNA polymerase-3 subunit epsilon
MLGFDTETTGVKYDEALILSSALVNIMDPQAGQPQVATVDYLDHGLNDPIPAGHIHQLSAGFLRENGNDPAQTLEAICLVMAAVMGPSQPLVGMNLAFDLTMLDRNCRRYGVTPLSDRCQIYAVDAYVLDKLVEPYRKGKRNLEALAKIYQVPWDDGGAHTAGADAVAAARVAWRIGRLYPPVGALTAEQITRFQTEWKAEQDRSFAAYRAKKGESTDGIDGMWPVRLPDAQTQIIPPPLAAVPTPIMEEDQPLW